MKYLFTLLFVAVCLCATAQIFVPKNFYLVKGPGPTNREDYYTDGQYKLMELTPFQTERSTTDEGNMTLLTRDYGVSFNKLKKDFYYGTGYANNMWKYVVVYKSMAFVLTSKTNNAGFKEYSKWLYARIDNAMLYGDQLFLKK